MELKSGVAWLAKKLFESENRKMINRALMAIGGPELVKKWMSKPMSEKSKTLLAVKGRRLYISGQSISNEVLKFFEDEYGGDHGQN